MIYCASKWCQVAFVVWFSLFFYKSCIILNHQLISIYYILLYLLISIHINMIYCVSKWCQVAFVVDFLFFLQKLHHFKLSININLLYFIKFININTHQYDILRFKMMPGGTIYYIFNIKLISRHISMINRINLLMNLQSKCYGTTR